MPFSFLRGVRGMSASDWRLLAGAAAAQVVTAYALRLASLPRLRASAARLRPLACVLLAGSDDKVIWAIEATGRRLRGLSTCLVRAVVVEMRLGSAERPLRFEIGVKRGSDGALQSHAWVREGDRVLTGGPVDDLLPMVAWEHAA